MNKTFCDVCGKEMFSWSDSNCKPLAWKIQSTGHIENFTIDACHECYTKIMDKTKYKPVIKILQTIVGIKK